MKRDNFKIDVYGWTVYFIEAENPEDNEKCCALIKKIANFDEDDIMDIRNDIRADCTGGGHHIFNSTIKTSILFLYRQTCPQERCGVIFHEARHLQDRVLRFAGIDDDEAAAYLTGYIGEKLYSIIIS